MPPRKHIVITTNIYRRSPQTEDDFDHPTSVNKLYKELHPALGKSISSQEIPSDIKVSWHIIITGSSPVFPSSIERLKNHIKLANDKINLKIFTYKNTGKIYELYPSLFDFNSYPGVRNASCAFAFRDGADLLIKIDADEELPETYLKEVLSTFAKYPKIKALGGFYLEEGRRLSPLQDPLEAWPKYSAMNVDVTRIVAGNRTVESFFAKGGNMALTRPFYTKICHPTVIPRGEDFAFILRAWLIYYNGNPKIGLKPKDPTFKFFVNPSLKMSIIHHTRHEAIRNFLNYTEKNLIRFAYETNTILHQDGLSQKDLIASSTYIGKVIFLPNFPVVVDTIYKELHQKTRKGTKRLTNPVTAALKASAHPQNGYPTYTKKQINASKKRVVRVWDKIQNKNFFTHYQKEQKKYIEALRKFKNQPFTFY